MLRWIFYFLLLLVTFLSLKPKMQGLDIQVNDKLGHGLAYFVLMVNGYLAFGKKNQYRMIVFLIFFGALMEILQGLTPNRETSFFDLLANSSGICLGWLFVLIFEKWIVQLLKKLKISM
jgi:VanZ family protein